MTAADVLVILLVILTVAVKLGPAGWLAGIAFGLIGWAAVVDGLHRFGETTFGPVGRVALWRAVLVGGVAALVVETTDPRPDPVLATVVLAGAALVMSGIGTRVARRNAPTPFDARLSSEVDAFLVLALSAVVSTSLGVWVFAIGLPHYAFLLAGRVLPWLRAPLPTRGSRGIVLAAQGVVLTAVATRLVPDTVAVVVTALALAALVVSVADDVRWLHRNREAAPDKPADAPERNRRVLAWLLTGMAGLLVLVALAGPNRLGQLSVGAFTRIPVEGLMAAALLLVLPAKARRVAVVVLGAGLGLLMIVKMFDMGFYEAFDRPFHPVFDWSFLGPAVDFVETSYGSVGAVIAVVGAGLLVVALLVLTTLAVRRLTRLAVGHRTGSTRALAALGVVWLVCSLAGVGIASRSAADHVYDSARQVRQGLLDGETFAVEAGRDDYRYTPGKDLLTSLRGKDVLFLFVESYGRVAVEDSSSQPVIDPLLEAGTEQLRATGFDSRSAFLTSPISGGGSWLAHATFQTGLKVDNPQRRTSLATLDRMTLSIAFNRAGWRTVGIVPANTEDWPEGQIYHFDKVYDSRNVGYKGPKFGFGPVPDQYTLKQFEETERSRPEPVMAQIALITSHTPFTPIPDFLPWNDVGDGSVYDPMPARGPHAGDIWPDPTKVRDMFTKSIEYSLKTVFSYLETYGDDNLVVVMLGDHQPQPIVSSQEGSKDVPISILSRDPAVLDAVSSWGWQDGLSPAEDAPVWPMESFRDRFLRAYGPQGQSDKAASPR